MLTRRGDVLFDLIAMTFGQRRGQWRRLKMLGVQMEEWKSYEHKQQGARVLTSSRIFLHLREQGIKMLQRSQGDLEEALVLNRDPIRWEGEALHQHTGG